MDERLIEEMAAVKWHQRRIWGVENALINDEMQRQATELDRQYARLDVRTRTGLAIKSLDADSRIFYNLSLKKRPFG